MRKFQPDQTRSGRLLQSEPEGRSSQSHQELRAVVKVESSGEEDEFDAWNLIPMQESNSLHREIPDEHTVEINDACTETSSSDMSEGLPAACSFENRGNRVFEPPKAPPGFDLWQHTKSKILHLTDHRFPNVFECGRTPGCLPHEPRSSSKVGYRHVLALFQTQVTIFVKFSLHRS